MLEESVLRPPVVQAAAYQNISTRLFIFHTTITQAKQTPPAGERSEEGGPLSEGSGKKLETYAASKRTEKVKKTKARMANNNFQLEFGSIH